MQKSTACTGNEVIVGRDATENSLHWWTGCDANGTVRFQLQDTSGTGLYLGGTGDVINDGDWHHLVFVRDESLNENRIYVDGLETHQGTHNYTNGFESTVPVDVGWLLLSGHYRYDGLLDELAIYDRALSDTEINHHYQAGLAGQGYCDLGPVAPIITSDPVTHAYAGVPYSYDVGATGSPVPTYTLSIAPAGMTIDENSGLIEWNPSATGDFNVTVEATNGVAPDDTQAFVISVTEAPVFTALRINCGGETVVDGAYTWESDASYATGGSTHIFSANTFDTTTNNIAAPVPPDVVYKKVRRESPHSYSFADVPDGNYTVRIHWTDQVTSAGIREIDYDIEGVRVLEDWDIYAEASGQYIAIDKSFDVTVSDGNGMQITSSAASGDAFESAIEITSRQNEAPTITSTPVTDGYVGDLYTYDVEADGFPAPTYSLTVTPTGMTIDQNSGLIEWTPTADGDYDVTVRASNSEGTNDQSFAIHVTTPLVCPADPLAYWKMDDSAVPPVVDEEGTNNGTCDSGGGACPAVTAGLIDGALDFDGSNDGVEIVDDPTLRWSASQDLTVSAWVRTTQDCTGNKVFIGKHLNSGEAYWWFGCTGTTGTVEFQFNDSDGIGGGYSSAYSINNDAWHHIAAVIQRPDQVAIYVDGESRFSTTLGTPLTGDLSSTRPLQIGHYLGSYNYDGLLDDVSVYQRALTESEIKLQYQNGVNGYGICEVPDLGACNLDMISYHKLDESANPYADLLGGPDATCTNCPTNVAGIVSGAQYFDGSDDEVDIPDNDQYDWGSGDSFSIEYWIRTNSDCAGNEVIIGRQGPTHPNPHIWTGCQDGSGEAMFVLLDSSGGNGGNGDWAYSGEAINDGEWHHIGVSRDTSNINLYMDGTLRQSVAKPSYTSFDSTTPFNLGYLNYGGHYRTNGDLDEVAFHDKALTPVEVLQHYYNGLANQGYCSGPATGTSSITIVKETDPDGGTGFQFDGTLGSFSLDDDGSQPFTSLSAGDYDVTETPAIGWGLTDVICTGSSTPIADGVTIHLGDSEDVSCTFINEELPAPGVEDVLLTSTSGNDYTTDDLTCSYTITGTATTSATAWNVDGAPQMALFMPMEGGSTAEGLADRSGSGHSPTNNGATWNANTGHNGTGGFYFESATINAGEVMIANGSYTKMAWVKQMGEDVNNILSGDNTGTSHAFWANCGPNSDSFGGGHGGNWCDVEETFEPTLDVWYHAALTYDTDTNTLRLYRDGVEVDSGIATLGDTNDPTIYLGGYGNAHEWFGHMDDARVYNYALSPEQIAAIHAQGGDVIVSQETSAGEEWQCQVTPFDDTQVGAVESSNLLAIQQPLSSPVITSSPVTEGYIGVPYTYDVDADGFPAPTFSLTVTPTEMTINENSGLIEWTPTAVGDYDVTVQAQNSEGSDPQSFVVSVAEPPPFALRINCGGSTVVDGAITWESSEPYVSGGANYTFSTSSVDTTTNSIADPIPPLDVYKTVRHQSPHDYDFPSVPNGNYLVRIHWTDQVTSAGLREIDYDIEGVRVEENWDIYAEAGGTYVAIDKVYEVTVSDGNGMQIISSAATGDAFESAIEIISKQDEAPIITSTPVTVGYVGLLYTYNVEADGYPPPTYTLTISPTGMTIDENTGLIEWTPLSLGDYDVTVQSSNSEGTDEQSFTIQVNAVTPCPYDMSGYWKLDETSSGLYEDSFGDDDGVCRATGACPIPSVDGKVNGAQEFSRVSQLGIDIPVPGGGQNAPFDWGQNDSFTIEYWMKRDGPINGSQISDNEVIIGRDDPDSSLHWWFGMWYDGVAHFQMGDKTGDSVSVDGPAIDDGFWHHLVGVRDAVNGINYLYVDGVQYSTPKPAYTGGFDSPTAALNLGWLDLAPGYHYTGLLDEVALYDRALTETEVKSHYYLSRGYCQTCETPIDIMPLGDSITVGNASGVVPDDAAYWVSFRKDLWESLNDAGYSVDFVGGESHGYDVLPAFDHEHEGHGGWTDSQIRDNVVAFLTANPADVVLLHIGTNGLSSDPAQVEEILDNIDSVSEDITVVLARIINRRDGSTTTTQFNDNVEAMALARMDPISPSYTADKIIIIDIENGANMVYGQAPASGDMWDNLHPYETGYAKMSNAWLHGDSHGSDGLEDFLPICAPPAPYAPTITSSAVTDAIQGWLYSYDVEADGFPAPTFSLTVTPTGMTIDPDSGLIEWTPAAIGDYDVTVQAGNGVAPDATQSFTIQVTEAPACPAETIVYYRLEEATAPYADVFGGSNATCTNCPTQAAGQVGFAQTFDGSDDEVVVADDGNQFDWAADDSFTIEYWMRKSTACTGNEVIVGRDDAGSSLHWWTGCDNNGTVRFQLKDTADAGIYIGGTGDPINDGDWHHLVFVRDESLNENRIYVDGLETHQGTHNYTNGFESTVPVDVGWLLLSGHYRYDGLLDELAIYDRALSDTEINHHYLAGLAGQGYCDLGPVAPIITSDPVTHAYAGVLYSYDVGATGSPVPTYTLSIAPAGMTIDENSGLIEWTPSAVGDYDVTVEAHNSEGVDTQSFSINVTEAPVCPVGMTGYWMLNETGSPTLFEDIYDGHDGGCAGNCPSPAAGIDNGAMSFSRPGQTGIDIPAHTDFDWGAADSFTIEYWMKGIAGVTCEGTATADNEVIVGRDDASTSLHIWTGCQAASGGLAVFQLMDTSGAGVATYGTTPINDGSWHHVAVVRDGPNDLNHVYVDGVLEGTEPFNYSQGFGSASAALNIGWLNLPDYYWYNGLLDEVAVYGVALDAAVVEDHYNDGIGKTYCAFGPEAPLFISTPVTQATIGIPYGYDVNASGYPAPTYTLTVSPTGMTIDTITGLIEWLPTSEGDFDVTVVASNSEGTAEQAFSIYVLGLGPCPADIFSYWRLDETSGQVFNDFIGDNNASCGAGNCPDFATGLIGGALDFNGTSDWLEVPADASLDWASDASFSIELWANFTNVSARNKVMIGRDEDGGYSHWWLGANQDTGYANFNLLDENREGVGVTGNTPLNDGQWHHIVAVRDDSINENRLYVDGQLVDAATHDYTASFAAQTSLGIGYMAYNHIDDYYYDGLLDEIALYNRAISEQEIRTHYYLARGYCEGCSTPITMMPLGDSITYDNHSGDTRPVGERIAYRLPLWEGMIDGGYSIDFVGSVEAGQDMGQDLVPPFDPDNEGWPGWTDAQIAANIYDWLVLNPAEVALLHIGTNGLNPSPDDVEDILNEIDRWEADTGNQVTVVLARIINRASYSSDTTLFNNNVAAMAQARIDAGDEIIIVDLENGAGLNYSLDTTPPYDDGDMYDNLHPNDNGYAKMAAGWLNGDSSGSLGLVDFLPVCVPQVPTAPQITSSPVTSAFQDLLYNYDVEASGYPAPKYDLSEYPAGMTIDPATGLIEWTPDTIGDYDVMILASNGVAPDATQSFSITVESPPPVFYSEDFEGFNAGDSPVDWLDTAAGNSMVEDDSLFQVYDLSGNMAFGTQSTATNIHSHYVGAGSASLSGYRTTGRMLISAANGGIGVTFHSLYPNSDDYYRLRRYGNNSFHISPHGTTLSGDTDTGVVPVANTWYWFIVEVEDTGSQTEVRAKVWAGGSAEPTEWQVDAYDDSSSRITAGTFGVWSYTSGSKYWDDLLVEPLSS